MKKILALDLGTSLGWAMYCHVKGITAGTIVLGSDKSLRDAKKLRLDRRLDIRISALSVWLESQPVDLLVWEDIRFASSQAQAHLWGSLRGVLWSFAARRGILTDCLDSSKLKLWTTGSGAADKPAMAASAIHRWPEFVQPGYDDNAIDALCLLQYFREKIKI